LRNFACENFSKTGGLTTKWVREKLNSERRFRWITLWITLWIDGEKSIFWWISRGKVEFVIM